MEIHTVDTLTGDTVQEFSDESGLHGSRQSRSWPLRQELGKEDADTEGVRYAEVEEISAISQRTPACDTVIRKTEDAEDDDLLW